MPKKFVGENSCAVFQKVSGSEKLYGLKSGGIKIFRRNIFVSQCRKLSQLIPFVLCLRKLPVTKKNMDKSGVSRFSVGNFANFLILPRIFVGEHFCAVFEKSSGSEKPFG